MEIRKFKAWWTLKGFIYRRDILKAIKIKDQQKLNKNGKNQENFINYFFFLHTYSKDRREPLDSKQTGNGERFMVWLKVLNNTGKM